MIFISRLLLIVVLAFMGLYLVYMVLTLSPLEERTRFFRGVLIFYLVSFLLILLKHCLQVMSWSL